MERHGELKHDPIISMRNVCKTYISVHKTNEVVRDVDRELSSCPNMLGEDEELVSAADLMRRHRRKNGFGTYRSVVEALCETGLERSYIERCLSKLFSCDYLMANFDRHLGNFGLIRDCVTLRYKGVAPPPLSMTAATPSGATDAGFPNLRAMAIVPCPSWEEPQRARNGSCASSRTTPGWGMSILTPGSRTL